MEELRIGIVGSRRRNTLADRQIVYDIVEKAIKRFPDREIVVVSGGCWKGADKFAEDAAKFFGVRTLIFPVPKDPPIKHRGEFRERAFARNREIAAHSNIVFALVHPDRTGGTENTVEHCKDLKVKCELV